MDITKCITISTAHISKKTAELLQKKDSLPVAVYDKGNVGYWVYCPKCLSELRKEATKGNIPLDLWDCMFLARLCYGCDWLCLDRDGEIVTGLQKYDW